MGELRTAARGFAVAALTLEYLVDNAGSSRTPGEMVMYNNRPDVKRRRVKVHMRQYITNWSRDVAKLLTSTKISKRHFETYGDMRVLDITQDQRDRCYWMICEGVKWGFISPFEANVRIDVLNNTEVVQHLMALAKLVKDLPWFQADPTFGRYM